MPTGYTSIIEDKEACTFNDYLWRCASAFLWHMREIPSGPALPPDGAEIASELAYVAELEARLDKFLSMDVATATEAADELFAGAVASHERRAAIAERYRRIRALAAIWAPPTKDHQGLKDFMLSQIDTCASDWQATWPAPEKLTGEQWRARHVAGTRANLKYAQERVYNLRKRHDDTSRWLRELERSVLRP